MKEWRLKTVTVVDYGEGKLLDICVGDEEGLETLAGVYLQITRELEDIWEDLERTVFGEIRGRLEGRG